MTSCVNIVIRLPPKPPRMDTLKSFSSPKCCGTKFAVGWKCQLTFGKFFTTQDKCLGTGAEFEQKNGIVSSISLGL